MGRKGQTPGPKGQVRDRALESRERNDLTGPKAHRVCVCTRAHTHTHTPLLMGTLTHTHWQLTLTHLCGQVLMEANTARSQPHM